MTPELWKQVEQLFDAVADLPPAARAALLDPAEPAVLLEVLALLQSDAQAAPAIAAYVANGVRSLHQDSTTIAYAGPYRLKKEIGRGGMGTVYLAERADGQYQGEVAIKLLRPGMDTGIFLERFKRERQALAKLHHPHIARLLDSGAADDGSQFIVMELIQGQQIQAYCQQNNLAPNAIVELFLPVARAVAYAHQQLIVHRDLKPGNILVTSDGSPKLLDFGICKTLDDLNPNVTGTGAQMLTPDFASPEQVRGDAITPASDIYSLGAVLYALLTGRSPHALDKYTAPEIARAVCEAEPTRPNISPDLDLILLKALQKDPARRYASAEQFAEDLRRVLSNEPVLARADTTFYRTAKFVRRHPLGVASAALVLLSLSVGLVAYAREAAVAKRQSAEARRLANAMIFNIHDKIQTLNGSLPARQEIVKLGLDYLDRLSAESASNPDLRREIAAAYLRMGNVQADTLVAHTGDVNGGLASYRKGLAALQGLPPTRETNIVTFDLLDRLAMLLSSRDLAEATRTYDTALPLAQQLARDAPGDVAALRRLATAHSQFALLLRRSNPPRSFENSAAAVPIFRELLKSSPDSLELHDDLSAALASVGSVQLSSNQTAAACDSYRESITHRQYVVDKSPTSARAARMLMIAYGHLGDALGSPDVAENLGDLPGSAAAFAQMLSIAERSHLANPGDLTASFDLAMALARSAALPVRPVPDRLALLNRAFPLFEEAMQRDPANRNFRTNYILYSESVADLYLASKSPTAARARLEKLRQDITPPDLSLAVLRRIAGTVRHKLAMLAIERRDPEAALSIARESLAIAEHFEKSEKASSERLVRFSAYATMGEVLAARRSPEAKAWLDRAIVGYTSLQKDPSFRPFHRETLRRLQYL